MQTCVKDSKVTIVMTYEEWMELSNIIRYTLDHSTPLRLGTQRDQVCKQILEDTLKLDIIFREMVQKEVAKIPDYLKMVIREPQEEIIPIPFQKKEVVM